MKPLKIFISGPLTNAGQADIDTMINNMDNAVKAGIECIKKGHYPFIPHLSLYTNEIAHNQGLEIPWQTWMDIDHAFLRGCDAVLYLGSSKGADIELLRAKDYGLRIFYSLNEVEAVP